MAYVTAALTIASAAYSWQQSRQQAASIRAQGRVNQQLSELDVRQAQIWTQDQLSQRQTQYERDLGAARAKFSASGVAVGSGSPLEVYNEIVSTAAEDMRAIQETGELQAYRARLSGENQRFLSEQQGAAAETRGNLALLRGGLSLAKEYRPASTVTIEGSTEN